MHQAEDRTSHVLHNVCHDDSGQVYYRVTCTCTYSCFNELHDPQQQGQGVVVRIG